MRKIRDKSDLLIALGLIFAAAGVRLLPHPANFAPIAAIALFGGSILPRRLAIWVPVGAMMLSDAVIGFHSLIAVTWGCYALTALASTIWLRKPSLIRGASLTISASLFFFVATNFAVWLSSGMYAHSWSGLVSCYAMALPFLRNTVLSDALYTSALFGIYALATSQIRLAHAGRRPMSVR